MFFLARALLDCLIEAAQLRVGISAAIRRVALHFGEAARLSEGVLFFSQRVIQDGVRLHLASRQALFYLK